MGDLYGASTLATTLPGGGRVKLTADGLSLGRESAHRRRRGARGEIALMLRIPGWAEGARCSERQAAVVKAGAFAALRRAWRRGHRRTGLPMEARLIEAHPSAEMIARPDRGDARAAGLLLESPDLPAGVRVDEIRLPRRRALEAARDAACWAA